MSSRAPREPPPPHIRPCLWLLLGAGVLTSTFGQCALVLFFDEDYSYFDLILSFETMSSYFVVFFINQLKDSLNFSGFLLIEHFLMFIAVYLEVVFLAIVIYIGFELSKLMVERERLFYLWNKIAPPFYFPPLIMQNELCVLSFSVDISNSMNCTKDGGFQFV